MVTEGSPTPKERQFLEMLKNMFIGARIEGQSGFINLMQIKSRYFDAVFSQILREIQEKTKEFPDFKDEMFEKLYTFFSIYFSETGSIYFSNTSLKSKVYEKVYSNDDVSLFWKTHMLYYVKTEKLWQSMSIEPDDDFPYKVTFDASKLEHQKSKREEGDNV